MGTHKEKLAVLNSICHYVNNPAAPAYKWRMVAFDTSPAMKYSKSQLSKYQNLSKGLLFIEKGQFRFQYSI